MNTRTGMVVEGLIKLIQSPTKFLFQFEVRSIEDFGFWFLTISFDFDQLYLLTKSDWNL